MGSAAYYATVLYTGACAGYIVFKYYSEIVLPGGGTGGSVDEAKKVALMGMGAAQIVLVWFLGLIQ